MRSKAAFAALNIGAVRPNFDRDTELAASRALWGNCLTLRIAAHLLMIPDFTRIATLFFLDLTHVYSSLEPLDRGLWDFTHSYSLPVSYRLFRFLGFFA